MRNNEKFSTNNIDSCLNNCPGFDPENPLLFDEVNNEFDVLTWMTKCQNDYTGTPSDAEQGCEHTLRCIRNCYPVQQ